MRTVVEKAMGGEAVLDKHMGLSSTRREKTGPEEMMI